MTSLKNAAHVAQIFWAMRDQAKLSREAAAEKLHVSAGTVRARETGARAISADALIKTAKAFGYKIVIVKDKP